MAGDDTAVEEGRRFARRMYAPRIIGFALGAICIGGGLWEVDAPLWVWIALGVHALAWPHVAYLLAARSGATNLFELHALPLVAFDFPPDRALAAAGPAGRAPVIRGQWAAPR